jgi:hypothetical protein
VNKATDGWEKRTVIDALRDLLAGQYDETKKLSWTITRLTDPSVRLPNGIPYCFTEVTFADGSQFGMEGFGDDAMKLYEESLQYKKIGAEPSTPLLLTT